MHITANHFTFSFHITTRILLCICLGIFALQSQAEETAGDSEDSQPAVQDAIIPLFPALAEEHFRGEIAIAGLKELGYQVNEPEQTGYATMFVALANDDADFSVHMWNVLHDGFYQKAGGDGSILKTGNLVHGLKQGYLIDKKTADEYNIRTLNDLSNPENAALFDSDEDGKGDLIGCNPGWGCEAVIESHLDKYGLSQLISHNRGDYFALMNAAIKRYKSGKPILYYTWLPQWISSVLIPGKDVVWLEALPTDTAAGVSNASSTENGAIITTVSSAAATAKIVQHSTNISETGITTPDTTDVTVSDPAEITTATEPDLGFQDDQIKAVMNLDFAENNPLAVAFLAAMQIPAEDESKQNLKMMQGENKPEDIRRHAQQWIKNNRETFDNWLELARSAAPVVTKESVSADSDSASEIITETSSAAQSTSAATTEAG